MDYIERISKNELARKVKLSDLAYNMNEQRLEKLDEKTRCRLLKKYVPAKQFLEECK